MQTISLHGKVSEDGMLRLEVPYGTPGEEVVIVVQLKSGGPTDMLDSHNWVDESYGACSDDPIERPQQGEWPIREELV